MSATPAETAIMWRADYEGRADRKPLRVTVRDGVDEHGDRIDEITHFTSEADAWEKLHDEVNAHIKWAGRAVKHRRTQLQRAHEEAGNVVANYAQIADNQAERERVLKIADAVENAIEKASGGEASCVDFTNAG